jgi:hypothetical protein
LRLHDRIGTVGPLDVCGNGVVVFRPLAPLLNRRELELVPGWSDSHAGRSLPHLPRTLLYDVAQLVGDELPAGTGARVIRAAPEKDVLAGGKGPGAQRLVQRIRLRPGVHPHLAKVGALTGAHLLLDGAIEGLPAAAGLVDPAGGLIVQGKALTAPALPLGQEPLHGPVAAGALESQHIRRGEGTGGLRGSLNDRGRVV